MIGNILTPFFIITPDLLSMSWFQTGHLMEVDALYVVNTDHFVQVVTWRATLMIHSLKFILFSALKRMTIFKDERQIQVGLGAGLSIWQYSNLPYFNAYKMRIIQYPKSFVMRSLLVACSNVQYIDYYNLIFVS